MKKLLIALALVASVSIANAATFTWGTLDKFFSIPADTITAGLANGYYASATSKNANTAENQVSSFGAVWTYALTLSDGVDSVESTGSLVTDARQVANSVANSLAYQDSEAVRNLTYSIVVTGVLEDGLGNKATLVSDAITGNWSIPKMGDWDTLSTDGAAGWTVTMDAPVIPEPTTGLLVLLGVAGLALRRRRA